MAYDSPLYPGERANDIADGTVALPSVYSPPMRESANVNELGGVGGKLLLVGRSVSSGIGLAVVTAGTPSKLESNECAWSVTPRVGDVGD